MTPYPCANCTGHQVEIAKLIRNAERRRAKSLDTSELLATIQKRKGDIADCAKLDHPGHANSRKASRTRHARGRVSDTGTLRAT